MMPARVKMTVWFDPATLEKVDLLAARNGRKKSAVIEAAVLSFLSPDAAERQEAALSRRLDRLTRSLDRLEQDQILTVETLALFIRHWLIVTPPAPADQQAAVRAKGRERYDRFVEALVRRMAGVSRLAAEVSREVEGEQP